MKSAMAQPPVTPPAERASLARLMRPWGVNGELVAALLTDFPEHLLELHHVWLWDGRQPPQPAEMVSCRLDRRRGRAIVGFRHCQSREQARRLVGQEIQIPLAERRPLPAGTYYVTDLIGCEVTDSQSGARLGIVRDVQPTGGVPLLAVVTPQTELLIPFAQEICPIIAPDQRRIVVRLLEGLQEQQR